jgi:hypothetical protein
MKRAGFALSIDVRALLVAYMTCLAASLSKPHVNFPRFGALASTGRSQ